MYPKSNNLTPTFHSFEAYRLHSSKLSSASLRRSRNHNSTFPFRKGYLPLVKPYMVAVQRYNVSAVNEALNEIYVEEEDYDRLHESIDLHDNFDQTALAHKNEKHELLEMRRVAAYIYKKAGRNVSLFIYNLIKCLHSHTHIRS
ncbi:unnamed protein product [Lactuca virosa]|uniref:Uncharacterized protein n=1 Tax=Lactuca virosa TaxID=75947 RepID=A0AAU9PGK6_9ASTR|nr:unnamed protein product [Lactuca virosa]